MQLRSICKLELCQPGEKMVLLFDRQNIVNGERINVSIRWRFGKQKKTYLGRLSSAVDV